MRKFILAATFLRALPLLGLNDFEKSDQGIAMLEAT